MPALPEVSRRAASFFKGLATPANRVSEAPAEAFGVALRRLNLAAQPHRVLRGPAAGRVALAEAAAPAWYFELPQEAGPDRAAEARRRKALLRSTACSVSSAKELTAFAPAFTTSTAIQH